MPQLPVYLKQVENANVLDWNLQKLLTNFICGAFIEKLLRQLLWLRYYNLKKECLNTY